RVEMDGNSLSRQALALVLCALLAQATFSAGQSYPAPENAGAVIGVKPGATLDNQPLEKAGPLSRNAVLRTNRTGRVRIRLRGGEVLSLGGGTELQVSRANPDAETAAVRVQAGQVRSEVGRFHKNEGSYDMTTPQAQITSRGNSDFYLDVASDRTRLIVYSGIVLVRPLHGPSTAPVDVAAGQTVVVNPGMVSRLELTAEDQEQDSIWQTSFPTDSLTQSNRPAPSHKKLYIILGAAGAAVGGIALAARGSSSKSSTPSTTTVPPSVPTIPAQ
ncbi:MAG TPA: FecR family protein, partial [Terriglobales bacterium]|nr:FecR family protein [Terriglobales bacterium]